MDQTILAITGLSVCLLGLGYLIGFEKGKTHADPNHNAIMLHKKSEMVIRLLNQTGICSTEQIKAARHLVEKGQELSKSKQTS